MPKNKKTSAEETLDSKLTQIRRQEEENQAKEKAGKLNLPYIDLTVMPLETDALILLDEKTARAGELAVIRNFGGTLNVAILNPENSAAASALEFLKTRGFEIKPLIASKHSLDKAFGLYKDLAKKAKEITGEIKITENLLAEFQEKFKSLKDIKKTIESIPPEKASQILEALIAGALKNDASDIHVEGRDTDSLLRYRIDGILHDIAVLTPKAYNLILSRIKLLSAMVLNIHDKAQDGRFTIKLNNVDVEVRVSIIPGPNGENIVMRLLNPKNITLNLKNLGFRDDIYDFVTKEIQRPNGMLITTGPTGSGKTTALYAFLKEVTNPEVKIITLEDPIEYHLAGVTQTQVEAERGYTFAAGLRAILRQDPDIVLVGEIRDKETAEIALHAALTGHVVFSTLHTNDAAGAIPRFIDMGANPTILSSALIDIMAQRLLRRICPNCKKAYSPNAEERKKIEQALQGLPATIKIPKHEKNFEIYKGAGCAACNQTGYKGRVGVYEIIPITPTLEKLITKSPSHAEVLEAAKKESFVSMFQDGVLKVLEGVTTLEELEDVVGEMGNQR